MIAAARSVKGVDPAGASVRYNDSLAARRSET
jgi:hypothetical protein